MPAAYSEMLPHIGGRILRAELIFNRKQPRPDQSKRGSEPSEAEPNPATGL